MTVWHIHTDSDGHKWLVNPQGEWIASFVPEVDPKEIDFLLWSLNNNKHIED